MKKITLLCFSILAMCFSWQAFSQCTTGDLYQGNALANDGTPEQQSNCNFFGEYNNTTNVIDGNDYTFSTDSGYVTVTTSDGATVLGHGPVPLTINGLTTSGDGAIRVYWHLDAACGTDSSCHVTTVQCISPSCTPPPAPSNDECSGATTLVCGNTLSMETTIGATGGSATSCIGSIGDDVWYTYVGNDQVITLNVNGSGESPQVEVYESTDGTCAGFTPGTCFASAGGGENPVTLDFLAASGSTYYVKVGNWINGNPDFDFSIETQCNDLPDPPECVMNPTPADDAINVDVFGADDRITLSWQNSMTGGPVTSFNLFFGTTSGALTDLGNFTTDQTIDVTGIDFDTEYFWTIVPSNAGGQASGCAEWSFTTESAPPAPANDDCSQAINIASLPYSNSQDATGATNNSGFITPADCGLGMNDGVWYTFTADLDGTVTIDVSNVVGWDPELAIYTGSCGAFTCVDSVDSGLSGDGETLSDISITAGTTYYINVGHFGSSTDGSEGPFQIDITGDVLNVNDFNNQNDFKYYPNPVDNILSLQAQNNIQSVSVINMLGQEVLKVTPNNVSDEINMSSLRSGAYFVRVTINDVTETIRVLKN